MNLLINFLTMALCAGTMAYCYILGRQVKALRDMRNGFGHLIEDMIKTTHNLELAFQTTKSSMEHDYEKLCDKIDEGAALIEYLSMTLDEIKALEKSKASAPTPIQSHRTQVARQAEESLTQIFQENGEDPLADIMPKGLNNPIKRPPPFIIPGEEYL